MGGAPHVACDAVLRALALVLEMPPAGMLMRVVLRALTFFVLGCHVLARSRVPLCTHN
jgi:hypothetical protein